MIYNTKFGKLDASGNIQYAPIPLVIDGTNVWTNVGASYTKEGYYPIVRTEAPDREGCYYTSYFVLDGSVIVEKWKEHTDSEVVQGG